jgi:putative DNA primase/helicase
MVAHAQAPAETERPATLPLPAIDALPAALRARPQWVAVRLVPKGDGKLDKVPVDPASGRNADAGNPATWGTVEAAHAAARRRGLGIGYVFAEDDPFTGVDKDGCRDPETGELTPDAFILLGRLATYAEASISGRGLHAIARATKPGPRCRRRRGDLEIYDRLRLFAFSGAHLTGTPRAVMDRQAEVAALYEDEFGEPEQLVARPAPRPVATDDATLIERARAARDDGRFDRLWRGDDADHGGNASDADYHFCRSAAFWTGGDAARIDAWYRASGRTRPKWDERRGATTYGAMTIKAAVASQRTFYDPEGRGDEGCALVVAEPAPAGGACENCARLREENRRLIAERRALLRAIANEKISNTGVRLTGSAVAFEYASQVEQHFRRHPNDPDFDGWVQMSRKQLTETTGHKPRRVTNHLKELEEDGFLEREQRPGEIRLVNGDGEVYNKPVDFLYVRMKERRALDNLEALATLDPGKEERRGGPRECPKHPEADYIVDTTVEKVERCAVCEDELGRTVDRHRSRPLSRGTVRPPRATLWDDDDEEDGGDEDWGEGHTGAECGANFDTLERDGNERDEGDGTRDRIHV